MPHSKDISEKILEDHNDVFADIVNGLVFSGKEVIRADELEDTMTVSQLKLEDGLHEQERDTIKRWKRGTIVLAAVGLENQTSVDPSMPLRAFCYDGSTYKMQVNNCNSARRQRLTPDPFYPSITIVLYFGLTRWSGPKSLRECFQDLPEELEPFIPDYPIHVIEVAFLTPEQLGRLKSDFRHVAEYLVYARTKGEYLPSDGRIDHVDEMLKLMEAITGDNRFKEKMNGIAPNGKEIVSMFNIIDSFIAKGREEARKEYETILAEKDRAKDRAMEEKDRAMEEKDRAMEEKDRAMEEKDRTVKAMNAMAQELRELKLRYGLA